MWRSLDGCRGMSERQTHIDSFMESVVNIAIGLVISTVANAVVLPTVTGHPLTLGQNVALSVIYTVISLVRSYAIRRAFNGRSVWQAIKKRLAD